MRSRILITGASSGLGEGMARAYADRGLTLGLAARRVERLDALAAEYPRARVATAALDVREFPAVPGVIAELTERMGGLDRAILNAGIGKGAPIGTGKAHANIETLQTNLVGTLVQAEAVLELFRAQGHGHLVLISSIAGQRGMPKAQTAYSASKAGVTAIGEGLAAEMAGHRATREIKITVIKPGYIRTDINKGVQTSMMATLDAGVAALVKAIDREPAEAAVPSWPWSPVSAVLRHAPEQLTRRII